MSGHPLTWSHMRQEIHQQPAAIAATVDALRPLHHEIRRLAEGARHVLFIGRGTSDNAAAYGQYLCTVHAGRLSTLASPSAATLYRARVDLSDVLAVAISQSGDTAEIVEALAWAGRCGARTLGITNRSGSALAGTADLTLVTAAGVERAVPATKTYTCQLAALAVLAFSLGGDAGALGSLDTVAPAVERLLETAPVAEELAQTLTYADRLVVVARGYATSTALEIALKLRESCYLNAFGISYADLLHGPIALVDVATPVLLVASPTDTAVLPGMHALARRCLDAGAHVFGIGGDARFAAYCRAHLTGSDLSPALAPIPLIVPGQLLTEALARAKGVNPDRPRGLRKITQTETLA